MIWSLKFAALPSPSSRARRGTRNGVANNNWSRLYEKAYKILIVIWYRRFKELSCWGTHPHQKGDEPHLHGDSSGRAPALRTLPSLDLCVSSSVCSAVSFIMPFNKLVFVFPCVLWASLANSQPWGRGCRNLLYSLLVRSTEVEPGIWSGSGGGLVRLSLCLWDLMPAPGRLDS